jgi:hypothetical protein
MIVKAISNQDFALIQRICFDQWHMRKCHARLRALEIISRPANVGLFGEFVIEIVSVGIEIIVQNLKCVPA